ncbi:hypothetical protein MSIMFB_03049 [Mycobacterium simulans]|uniref:RNA-binding protein n=1 Tax=Mycobacterium simulans TaxID=627089 RepID=A0A7Z7IN83_9MYCO|nr:hypothetical protein [Mycobacterium simulans]SOJ55567.1 hypothetical protein MSIMFB_03049 [Mycobacterium simulans]
MNGTGHPMSSGTHKASGRARSWLSAGAVVLALAAAAGALSVAAPAQARADACASVGGRHVSVGGCTDVAGTIEQYVPPPAYYPPPSESAPPPPPPEPAGYASVCANVGRHVNVSGCVSTG